ncbi:hypothetical protein T265_10186 [Opisthorchis viverrini]|uniref:YTH domain-containing protein n=1 Tax=Opisthorchis viverrini TaxID=6198 RepID=A0A074ZE64_OPIVI|nr:hypothetical protein T265_10186 [Opisthorchis viverrini]KER21495.1 hypothetical protein T265_10186 [Opisthorchis viverrini]
MPSSCSNGIRSPEHNPSAKRGSKRTGSANRVNKFPNPSPNKKNQSNTNNGNGHAPSKDTVRTNQSRLDEPSTPKSPAVTTAHAPAPSTLDESPVMISVAKVAGQPPEEASHTDDASVPSQPDHIVDTPMVQSEQQQANSQNQIILNHPPEVQSSVLPQQPFVPLPYNCALPCTIPDCQGCYTQICPTGTVPISTASVSFYPQRPLVTAVSSVATSGALTSSVTSGSPGGPCYILVGQELEAQRQQQLYATQMALSQMNLNVSLASDCAVGVPLVQTNGYVRDGPVPGTFIQGVSQPSSLQMVPQSQLKGSPLVNNGSMYALPHGVIPSVADPATLVMQTCSATGSTGCATPIQSIYNSTPSNASTTSGLAEHIPSQTTVPLDTGNPMSTWPATYLDPSGMWFPSTYTQPFYPSLPTNPLLNYTNTGSLLPAVATDRCYQSPTLSNTPCEKVPGSLPVSAYQSALSAPLYSNGVRLPLKSFYGLGQSPNVMCTSNQTVSNAASQPFGSGNNWINPTYYQQLLLQSLANSRTTAQTGVGTQYHPLFNYGLQSSDRLGTLSGGRKRGSATTGVRTIPCKVFDESELAALELRVNPPELDRSLLVRTRYFVIKSDCVYNVHQSIRHGVWCSTRAGNQCLDDAFHSVQVPKSTNTPSDTYCDRDLVMPASAPRILTGPLSHMPGHIILFFSVRSSGYLSGVAEMIGPVNPQKRCSIWQDARFRGEIPVRWLYVKNVPNNLMKHIIVDSRPVTSLRDTSEISPSTKGEELLNIVHNYCPQRMPAVSQPYCG